LKSIFSEDSIISNLLINRGIASKILNYESNGFSALFQNIHKVFQFTSKYQKIEVIEHPWFGRALILDDVIQFSDKFVDIYSKALSDKIIENAIKINNNINKINILIIGAGDGRISFYIKNSKYYDIIDTITIVEIDEQVSDTCMKYFD